MDACEYKQRDGHIVPIKFYDPANKRTDRLTHICPAHGSEFLINSHP